MSDSTSANQPTALEAEVPIDAPAQTDKHDDDAVKDAEVPGKECTVFQDPLHYTIKHPLLHPWTLWYDIPSGKVSEKDWLATLKQIYTFRYVEDFWGYVMLIMNGAVQGLAGVACFDGGHF